MQGTKTQTLTKFKFLKKATELSQKPIRALIYGEPGVGKTTLLATLPRPVVILDFEGGAAVRLRGEEDIYIAEIGNYEELKEALNELEALKEVRSIAFDGFSVFLQALLDEITRKSDRKAPTFREWNLLTTLAKGIVLNLRKPDKHLVFTVFEKQKKDKETGKVVEIHPDLPTSIRRYLRGLVDLEGRLTVRDGKRVLVFNDPIAETKDRTGRLGVEGPDFGKIFSKIFEGETETTTTQEDDLDSLLEEDPYKAGTATSKQIGLIHQLVKRLGWGEEKYRQWLFDMYRRKTSKELSKKEASLAIEQLQKYIKEEQK
jgi:phage nucleotide-binding protein